MSPKRASIAAGLSKEERKRQRGNIGKLRHQVISQKTEDRYQQCFTEFWEFHRLSFSFALPPLPVFDDMVAEYVEHLGKKVLQSQRQIMWWLRCNSIDRNASTT